jgi:uncharacterized protein (TIGR02300 family)
MADKKFGLKRICSNCELKFYDLNKKSPLICPQCKTEIVIEDELSFVNNNQMAQVEKKTEIKDEFSDLENADEQSDEDDVISLDDAAVEEENQKN